MDLIYFKKRADKKS